MSFSQKVRKLDMFKKVPNDLSEGTNRGGFISLITILSISFFMFYELKDFLSPRYAASIMFQQYVTRKQMRIFVDITFPKFPCQILSLDLQDVMMSHSANIGNIKKQRLNSDGSVLSQQYELLRQSNPDRQYQQVKRAFQSKRGCRITGSFTVKEVPGNFHVSGHAYHAHYDRLIDQNIITTLDLTHVINDLHFGQMKSVVNLQKKHPQAVLYKLNGKRINLDPYASKQQQKKNAVNYHIDVVPTIYQQNFFSTIEAYQYNYQKNVYYSKSGMPAIYFNYHVGGMAVHIEGQNDKLIRFLIKLCAIIGGTYTIAAFIDNALDQIIQDRRKQFDLS